MQSLKNLVVFGSLVFLSVPLYAQNKFPVQARLYASSVKVDPKDLNLELASQDLKEFSQVTKFGVEMTYPIARFFEGGLRYEKIHSSNPSTLSSGGSGMSALIDQDTVQLIGRIPVIKNSVFKFDFFGAVGGSNTTVKIKSASQDGELNRRASGDWLASVNHSVGSSFSIGFKGFYLTLEGGYTGNKVDSFTRTGTVNSNVDELDLSGSYASIGLVIDGVQATSR